jgi:hypothetical protein
MCERLFERLRRQEEMTVIAKLIGRGKNAKVICPFNNQPCLFYEHYKSIPLITACSFCPEGLKEIARKGKQLWKDLL